MENTLVNACRCYVVTKLASNWHQSIAHSNVYISKQSFLSGMTFFKRFFQFYYLSFCLDFSLLSFFPSCLLFLEKNALIAGMSILYYLHQTSDNPYFLLWLSWIRTTNEPLTSIPWLLDRPTSWCGFKSREDLLCGVYACGKIPGNSKNWLEK